MTYLFIVSHIDDSEISCGGTIQKLLSSGHCVNVISLSCIYSGVDLSEEFVSSMKILGTTDRYAYNVPTREFHCNINYISEIVYEKTLGYDYVFTHDCKDKHDDHRTLAEQVRRIYNGNLYTFITPINGDETPNYFVELSESQLETKIKALKCYKSQAHRSYMDPDFIRSWARYNGIKCGKLYAEAFKIERLIQ